MRGVGKKRVTSGNPASIRRTRRQFARDPLNLTLASPAVNRYQKGAKDVAEWIPNRNACWFAARVVAVRTKYGLTIDPREAEAINSILDGCLSTTLYCEECADAAPATRATTPAPGAAPH